MRALFERSAGRRRGDTVSMPRAVLLVAAAAVLAAVGVAFGAPAAPSPEALAAAVCADYPNQAAAQRAADTRDADGDGIYCENLPCPCSTKSGSSSDEHHDQPAKRRVCVKPKRVQPIGFSATRDPHIRRHVRDALRRGWPRILVLNRRGADARRERLLEAFAVRDGYDRDEYPPAVGRGRGEGLTRGRDPTGWKADVAYVPSSENRSHGSVRGIKLRRFCDGTRFTYVFY
jgi:hypothetical protein